MANAKRAGSGKAERLPLTLSSVMLASFKREDLVEIPLLLRGTPWIVIKATSWNEVVQLIRAVVIPVMLCDRELPGIEWPASVAGLRHIPRSPQPLVLSDSTASNTFEQLLNGRWIGVLVRPLRQDDLVAAMDLARM